MTTHIGRWLLVLLAVVGLAVTASVVGAHGTNTPAGTPADWNTAPAGADSQVTHHGPQRSGHWAGAPAEAPAGNATGWHHHDGWQDSPGADGAYHQPGGNTGPAHGESWQGSHGPGDGWQDGHGPSGTWQDGHGPGGGFHHAGHGC